jgi:hypothetical protein
MVSLFYVINAITNKFAVTDIIEISLFYVINAITNEFAVTDIIEVIAPV